MNIHKYFWALRGLCYKLTFKKFGNYSYIVKPTYLLGTKNTIVEDKVKIYPEANLGKHCVVGTNAVVRVTFSP